MCKCRTPQEHSDQSQYVTPAAGDPVVRLGEPRVGLLYDVGSFAGGLPRAYVVYDDGTESRDCLFLFQSPALALLDPCWGLGL